MSAFAQPGHAADRKKRAPADAKRSTRNTFREVSQRKILQKPAAYCI